MATAGHDINKCAQSWKIYTSFDIKAAIFLDKLKSSVSNLENLSYRQKEIIKFYIISLYWLKVQAIHVVSYLKD